MHFSKAKLHQTVFQTEEQKTKAIRDSALLMQKRQARVRELKTPLATPGMVSVTLTAVTKEGNFDAYINIEFPGAAAGTEVQILVDTGNSMLIIPQWESI